MKKVLLVDDDEAMLFAFKKLSRQRDIIVETADNRERALHLLLNDKYDVLIADLNLAGAGGNEGLDIIRKAKTGNPDIQTFLWSAYDMEKIRNSKSDIDGFLDKPIKYETILSLINGE